MDLVESCTTKESAMQAVQWFVSMGVDQTHALKALLYRHFRNTKLSDMTKECVQILFDSVQNGSYETLQIVLSFIDDDFLFHAADNSDKTFISRLLNSAVEKGNLSIVRLLVNRGADVNGCYHGKPLLHYCLTLGYLDVAKEMVRAGADVTSVDARGDSALFSVICSSVENKANIVEWLLQQGANPRQKGSSGKEPIHIAAAHSGAVVAKLIEAGSDVNVQDPVKGDTPLHVSCARCCRDAIVTLIKFGAKLNIQNHIGETPLSVLLKFAQDYHNFHAQTRRNLAKHLVKIGFRIISSQNQQLNTVRTRRKTSIDKGAEVYRNILASQNNPTSLQHFCRLKLRDLNQRNSPHKVIGSLEIPNHLRDYLLFRDGVLSSIMSSKDNLLIDNVAI